MSSERRPFAAPRVVSGSEHPLQDLHARPQSRCIGECEVLPIVCDRTKRVAVMCERLHIAPEGSVTAYRRTVAGVSVWTPIGGGSSVRLAASWMSGSKEKLGRPKNTSRGFPGEFSTTNPDSYHRRSDGARASCAGSVSFGARDCRGGSATISRRPKGTLPRSSRERWPSQARPLTHLCRKRTSGAWRTTSFVGRIDRPRAQRGAARRGRAHRYVHRSVLPEQGRGHGNAASGAAASAQPRPG